MRRLNWTERILSFPVRAAAVEDFLRELRSRGSADLNAVLTTLNDAELCRESVNHWVEKGWIAVSPSTPLHALAGPAFSRDLTLARFCGGQAPEEAPGPKTLETGREEQEDDEDQ